MGSQVVGLRCFEGGSSGAGLSSLHQLRYGPTGLLGPKPHKAWTGKIQILWGQLWGVDFAFPIFSDAGGGE